MDRGQVNTRLVDSQTVSTNEASQNGAFVTIVHECALADTLRINVKWPQFGPAWQSCELPHRRVFNLSGRKSYQKINATERYGSTEYGSPTESSKARRRIGLFRGIEQRHTNSF
jgi:hypothetical protein